MTEKTCSGCERKKDVGQFSFKDRKKGRRNSLCKPCHSKYRRGHYQKHRGRYLSLAKKKAKEIKKRNKQYLLDHLLTHPCVDCDEADPVVLEFDHVRGEKCSGLSKMALNGLSVARIQEEIEKCEVRCANCHRRKTVRERGGYRWKHQAE